MCLFMQDIGEFQRQNENRDDNGLLISNHQDTLQMTSINMKRVCHNNEMHVNVVDLDIS